MKAHCGLVYNPENKSWWRENYTLKMLADILVARAGLKSGDKLRLIMVPDEDQEAIFLQGSEVAVVHQALMNYIDDYSGRFDAKPKRDIALSVLERIDNVPS